MTISPSSQMKKVELIEKLRNCPKILQLGCGIRLQSCLESPGPKHSLMPSPRAVPLTVGVTPSAVLASRFLAFMVTA